MLGAGAALLSPKGSAICTLPNLPPVEALVGGGHVTMSS